MTYGLVGDGGSQTEIAVMKSKKVPDGNITCRGSASNCE